MATEEARKEILLELFSRWDLSGNGAVAFAELMQVLQHSERVAAKDSQKWVRRIEAQIQQGKQANRSRRGSATSLKLQIGGTINFNDLDGEPSLDPDAFVAFLHAITHKDSEEEFNDFVTFCRAGVEGAIQSTQGSRSKQLVWQMFRLLDVNNDGFVDLVELEVLLKTESKSDKKHVAKWKAYLLNKGRDEDKIREEDLSQDEESAAAKYSLRMSLKDFQLFLHEYCGGENSEEKVAALLGAVEVAVQEKNVKYITEFKVQDIINDIMGDLLRERPKDVLAGIEKSVHRLQRTGKYPKPLSKRVSAVE